MKMTPTQAPVSNPSGKRRAVVLVAVLVVIVLLSLAGYQYADLMMAEYRVAVHAHRSVQAQALANSGIHYAAAMLSFPGNLNGRLGGNYADNPSMFKGITVQGGEGIPTGYFTIIAPPEAGSTGVGDLRYGVTDEGGRINLNALMEIDIKSNSQGQKFQQILAKLPNMTPEIANAIYDWMDADNVTSPGGAESDYYLSLTPPYRCKNGPIDSIDELLLVKGVTRELLYGTDANRNGTQEDSEGANGFDRGWSAYLTVHSREQNIDPTGKPCIYLKMPVPDLQIALAEAGLDENLIKFLILYRQYGPLKSRPTTDPKKKQPPVPIVGLESITVDPNRATQNDSNFTAIFNLIDDDPAKGLIIGSGNNRKFLKSPLADPAMQKSWLPKLFEFGTLVDPVEQMEIPARININTAPLEVLATLAQPDLTELTDGDIQKIDLLRRNAEDDIFQSPVWLFTEAQIKVKSLRLLEEYITTRQHVFRVQSVGYFEGKGPAVRVEAVIDTNFGRPRIVAYRNLTDLGKGWNAELNP